MDPVIEEVVPEVVAEVVPEVTSEVVEAAPVVVAGPKFRKVIQPKDDDGTLIGQPHVYEGETQEELDEKMAEAIANGTKKIRQLTRQATLESAPPVPEGAIVDEEPPVWKPRELTEEEKFIVKTDPEKAFAIQFEAQYGMPPDKKAKADQEIYNNSRINREKAETDIFTDDHPDYYRCKANQDAIVTFMQKNKLAWRATNLDLAFTELSAKGLLANKPEAPVPPAPVVEARTEPTPQPATRTSFPSAIRNNTASASVPVPVKKGPSAEEIAKMTADEYKRLYPELQHAR